MVNKYYSDIQHTKSIVNKINFQGFDYIISYLIKLFLKNIIFRTGKSINHAFINPIIMKNKNTKKDTNKIQYNPKRKILSYTNDKNAIIRNYVSISLIIFILITLLSQIKSNNIIYDSFHLKYSYNITLKIKGIGESNIFCNEEEYNFTGIDYLEKIYINNIQENPKKYSYYFNQTENFVELIWNDNLNDFSYMFRKCSNITEINLSNFNTSKIKSMNRMFTSCSSLTSLDLSNIDTSQVENMENMFHGCSSLTPLDLSNFNTSKVVNMDSMFRDCSLLTSLNLSNFDTSKVTNMIYMFYNCLSLTSLNLSNFDTSLVESMSMMFYDCINLEYINMYNFGAKESVNATDMLANVPDNIVICVNEDSYTGSIVIAQIKNINCYTKDCSNDWKSNQKKIINNINQCIDSCSNSTEYIYEYNGKCYENCSYYYYIDNKDNFHCIENCSEEYPKLSENKKECIKNDIQNVIKDLIKEKNEIGIMSKEQEIGYYDNIIQTIEEFYIGNYDISKLEKGEDEMIKAEKITVTLTTSQNQINNINNNMTSIDLGECETLLRNYYNLTNNETLYMKKMDIYQEGLNIPKVEYDVYCRLFGRNLIKLNLTVCENTKISIFTPFIITENIDKYNSSSGYYNDICYTTTSEDGTDITIKDRRSDYYDGDKIICQEDCDFTEYDYAKSKAKCSCKVQETPASINDMNINKNNLLKNFINIKNLANFNFFICYKNLLNKIGLLNNIGSYIILGFIFFHFLSIIIFCSSQYNILIKKIKSLNNINLGKLNIKETGSDDKETNKRMITFNSKLKNRKKRANSLNKSKILPKNKKVNKIIEFNQDELNDLSYNLAIMYDKRTYWEYYASLLKTKHNFISSFFNDKDYNSTIIKIDLFFIGFGIEYCLNALFFNDDTMHKIYQSKGDFDIMTQLPITIYSTLISYILNAPLNFLGLSNDDIISYKQDKTKSIAMEKKLEKRLTIKFIFYFIIGIFLLAFLWYYVAMFCVIYKNTQIHLIKDTLMSFGQSLILPFVYYLIPGLFRIPALSNAKGKRKCLYNFSKVFLIL